MFNYLFISWINTNFTQADTNNCKNKAKNHQRNQKVLVVGGVGGCSVNAGVIIPPPDPPAPPGHCLPVTQNDPFSQK